MAQAYGAVVGSMGLISKKGIFPITSPLERTRAECVSWRQALQMAQAMRESENPRAAVSICACSRF